MYRDPWQEWGRTRSRGEAGRVSWTYIARKAKEKKLWRGLGLAEGRGIDTVGRNVYIYIGFAGQGGGRGGGPFRAALDSSNC